MSTPPALPGPDEVAAAARRIAPHLHRTPLWPSETLSRRGGRRVWMKCENLQKTGSFKPRGSLNRLATLDPADRERGVVTISAGNHAQGVAFAAAALGVSAVVVMPAGASAAKVAATRDYGAECILHGDVHAAFQRMEEIRQERGLTLVHPFDDPMLVAGHGTVGQEILEELSGVDAIVCGIGGGGLAGGICAAVKPLRPEVTILGVEPRGAATMTRALEAGEPVRLDSVDTIADGLAPPFVGELNLRLAAAYLDGVVLVDDDAIAEAALLLLERTKLLVEPAGAAAVAALLGDLLPLPADARVAVVLSGGNFDLRRLGETLAVQSTSR